MRSDIAAASEKATPQESKKLQKATTFICDSPARKGEGNGRRRAKDLDQRSVEPAQQGRRVITKKPRRLLAGVSVSKAMSL
jgi:hypothetical protein